MQSKPPWQVQEMIRQQTGMLFVNSLPAKAMPLPLSTNFLSRKLLGWRKRRVEIERGGREEWQAGQLQSKKCSGGGVAACVPLETGQGNSRQSCRRLQYCVAHDEI